MWEGSVHIGQCKDEKYTDVLNLLNYQVLDRDYILYIIIAAFIYFSYSFITKSRYIVIQGDNEIKQDVLLLLVVHVFLLYLVHLDYVELEQFSQELVG